MTSLDVDRLHFMAEAIYFYAMKAEDPAVKAKYWEDCVAVSRAYSALGGKENVHIYLNFALQSLGRVEEAYESCVEGLRIDPEQEYLLVNIKHYAKYLDIPFEPGQYLN